MSSALSLTSDPLQQPIRFLKGVGPNRSELFKKLEIETIGDLLHHLPLRYEEWKPTRAIGSLSYGEEVTIRGKILSADLERFYWGRRNVLSVLVNDGSGSIEALFFNQPYLRNRFQIGEEIALHGRVSGKKKLVLPAPRVESASLSFPKQGSIVPIYPATEGVGQASFCSLIAHSLEKTRGQVPDPIPAERLTKLNCLSLGDAFFAVHRPQSLEHAEKGRRRLALEELIALQKALQTKRDKAKKNAGVRIEVNSELHERILKRLPFQLTQGQKKVISEIRTDLVSGFPMRRLLQGDVGSGKTAVAIYACLAAIGTYHQAAFMAPTEILAEQHARVLRRYLEGSKVQVALLIGSLPASEKRRILQSVEKGETQFLVGTHAMIQDSVRFRDLALIVIDEQHRFGVLQREKLYQKGLSPHLLSMTATPIPRTLALTVYGDLDISTLREKPPGRGSIETHYLTKKEQSKWIREMRQRLQNGEQLYWVTPRIEDEGEESRSAITAFKTLSTGAFSGIPIGLAHGRMKAQERDDVLNRFRRGTLKVLVATTLIEVGIDVPAATLIVIDGAEKLGLAQLHQLRGRVGRGTQDSFCYLMGSSKAKDRFSILETTSDGFDIAEADLKRRGPGELTGLRQSGLPPLAAADLERDFDLLLAAREEAAKGTTSSKKLERMLID